MSQEHSVKIELLEVVFILLEGVDNGREVFFSLFLFIEVGHNMVGHCFGLNHIIIGGCVEELGRVLEFAFQLIKGVINHKFHPAFLVPFLVPHVLESFIFPVSFLVFLDDKEYIRPVVLANVQYRRGLISFGHFLHVYAALYLMVVFEIQLVVHDRLDEVVLLEIVYCREILCDCV